MTLENKLNITDPSKLAREEEKISKKKAMELYDKGLLDELETDTFSALAFIHNYLFDEIHPLTSKTNDRDIYMKGIDNSYLYEGYNAFKTEEL